MNILRALNDPNVFAPYFKSDTWTAWRVFLAALFGLPLTRDQLVAFKQFTGRDTAPTGQLKEAWLVCGRRAGKSFILAIVATFLACFREWKPYLGPGEIGTIMVIAKDRLRYAPRSRRVSLPQLVLLDLRFWHPFVVLPS